MIAVVVVVHSRPGGRGPVAQQRIIAADPRSPSRYPNALTMKARRGTSLRLSADGAELGLRASEAGRQYKMEQTVTASLAAISSAPAVSSRYRSFLRLAEASKTDAEHIRMLRNDPDLNAHLNAPATTTADQLEWLEKYKLREGRGEELYFIIVCEGRRAGVVRMYDFRLIEERRSFCWGSWIIVPPSPPGLAVYSALAIYELGFKHLGFEMAHFDVRKANERVISFHLRSGAEIVGETDDDLLFHYSPASFERFRAGQARVYQRHRSLRTPGD